MREVVLMWRDSRMIVLTVVVTAVYTAVLIPFKEFVLIPGFTEIRPANVYPVVFGLLFGPAAAWGSAFGNLLGDVFGGTLTAGSVFGFVGNFFFGFASYRLWGNLTGVSSGREPAMRSGDELVEFTLIALVASSGTGAIIAWGLEVLGLVPFAVIGPIIAVNNFVTAAVFGPPLLYVLYPRVKRDGLLYPHLMRVAALPAVGERRQRTAAAAVSLVSVLWLVVGVAVSVGLGSHPGGVGPGPMTPPAGAEARIQRAVGSVALVVLLAASALSGERLSTLLERGCSRRRRRPSVGRLLGVGDLDGQFDPGDPDVPAQVLLFLIDALGHPGKPLGGDLVLVSVFGGENQRPTFGCHRQSVGAPP